MTGDARMAEEEMEIDNEEQPPVDKTISVSEFRTIRKGKRWWSAVALVKSFGRNQVAFYLWQRKNDRWARKQKFVIHNRGQWETILNSVEEFLPELK
ncbi:hypothetical protein COY52_06520 [Candidatus Desantisbacteria bacterium CG_4_10_14_0_8_um_filter_48_22]|uniref:Uncharacterized protein n=1 Tax=Candidatus Desantisbacteria bacterium CG_4_10_14_0_8_um_filter_48_22 TaxID=1974543 RepID=A0A2M7SB22_9BACT|nr:MAG: hypothetical protein COY52_06520 [Candidatus Desantisbacteria bacterium CG_4_10_14_0_8_um_filter_48_22]PJB28171.1 MAG: hypothetical protein CO111_02270 [Candidatus Desantisbacteria bacterium CG_4_9_14_3_um_filter_50_7]